MRQKRNCINKNFKSQNNKHKNLNYKEINYSSNKNIFKLYNSIKRL